MDPDGHHFKVLSACSKPLHVSCARPPSLKSYTVVRSLPIADYCLKGAWTILQSLSCRRFVILECAFYYILRSCSFKADLRKDDIVIVRQI